MKWRGRPSSPRGPAAPEPGSAPAGPGAASVPAVGPSAPLDFEGGDAEQLKRNIASHVIAEHRRELRRLGNDIDRLSLSTSAAGSVVEELAAGLDHELDRLRSASSAWARGTPDR